MIPARVRESDIEAYLDRCVRRAGGITRKFVSPGRVGVPDRIVLYRGYVEFIELKAPGGRLTPSQVREHRVLRENGALVGTLASRADVDAYVAALTSGH